MHSSRINCGAPRCPGLSCSHNPGAFQICLPPYCHTYQCEPLWILLSSHKQPLVSDWLSVAVPSAGWNRSAPRQDDCRWFLTFQPHSFSSLT